MLLPPCIRQRPFAIAGLWQDVSLLVLAPQRGVAKAISSATRQLLARALLSNLTIPPVLAPPVRSTHLACHDCLAAVRDMNMLNDDNLFPTAPHPVQSHHAVLVAAHHAGCAVHQP